MDFLFNKWFILWLFIGGFAICSFSGYISFNIDTEGKYLRVKILLFTIIGGIGFLCFMAAPALLAIDFLLNGNIAMAIVTMFAHAMILFSIVYSCLWMKSQIKIKEERISQEPIGVKSIENSKSRL